MPTCSGACAAVRSRDSGAKSSRCHPTRSDASSSSWHGIGSIRRGPEALLDAVEQLQGASLPFSILEREVLPARVAGYQPSMLDTLMAAGEVVWAGVESLGERDGRIALYLTDHMPTPAPARRQPTATSKDERAKSSRTSVSRRVVLRRTPRRHGRRVPRRNGDRVVGPRLERAGHQRHAACAARVHQRDGDEATEARAAGALQIAAARAANRRRPLVARGHDTCVEVLHNGVEHGDRAPACSLGMASSRARRSRTNRSAAASRSSTRCSRRWRMPDASAADTS